MLPVDAAAVMTCTQVNDTVPSQLETADSSTGRISERPQAIRPEPPNRPNGDRTNRMADTVCITVARAACRVDAINVLSAKCAAAAGAAKLRPLTGLTYQLKAN